MRSKAEIDAAVRDAMTRYEEKVLDPRYFNPEMEVFDYPFRVTAGEVLKMAGKVSRATLGQDYHKTLQADLSKLIDELKRKTGKRTREGTEDDVADSNAADAAAEDASIARSRIQQLAQTISALQYRILALERENASLKAKRNSQVVNLPTLGDSGDR